MSVTKVGEQHYVVRYRDGGRGSRAHKRTFRGPRAGEDAKRFDRAIGRAKDLGQLAAEVVGSEQTLEAFVVEWWEKYADVYLAPGTRLSYAYTIDLWITPYLGTLRLSELTRETIDTWMAGIRAAGAKPPTANRTRAILQGVLARAVEWRRLPANPAAGVARIAHVRSSAIDARTPDVVETIRARLSRKHAALVSVLAYEGLRPAEAFALQWADVLTPAGKPRQRLRIERSLSAGEVSTTKNRRAREPELFAPVARELAELYMANGRPELRSLVFPNARGGHRTRHNFRAKTWKPTLEKNPALDYFRPYDLRHTCATLLIYAGWTFNEVGAHLGHSPEVTARTYSHVFSDAAKRRRVPIADAISTARRVQRARAS